MPGLGGVVTIARAAPFLPSWRGRQMPRRTSIARLLFVAGKLSPKQHEKTRYDLLEYCKRDMWGTVKLLEGLRELAGVS